MLTSFGMSFGIGQRPGTITTATISALAQIWYDAASPAYFQPTNPSNGSNITQWNDKSNYGHNAAPTKSKNPTYVTTVTTVNGVSLGGVQFNGTDQNFQVNITNPNWAASKTGFTIYAVVKPTSSSSIRTVTLSDVGGFGLQGNGGVWLTSGPGGTGTSVITYSTGSLVMVSSIFDGSGSGNNNRLKFRYQRAGETLTYTGTISTQTSSLTSAMNFGWDSRGSGSGYFQGIMCEIMLFTQALNSVQQTQIEDYLGNKWGI